MSYLATLKGSIPEKGPTPPPAKPAKPGFDGFAGTPPAPFLETHGSFAGFAGTPPGPFPGNEGAPAFAGWCLHFADSEPQTVWLTPPATHGEVLSLYPAALAAEPVADTPSPSEPMAADEAQRITGWLCSLGEPDVDAVLAQCERGAGVRAYFTERAAADLPPPVPPTDDMVRCRDCRHLRTASGTCAQHAALDASRQWQPNPEQWQRCACFERRPNLTI